MSEGEDLLREALDHIDAAIHLLRKYAKLSPEKAESVEDIIMLLEDAGEELESMIGES